MAELTVDDLPAEAHALEVRPLELTSIGDQEVREPHRHAYHELIWVREGRGSHLIAKGQVHQFERAERVSGVVVRSTRALTARRSLNA